MSILLVAGGYRYEGRHTSKMKTTVLHQTVLCFCSQIVTE